MTYEIGTRGRRTDYSLDLAVYRANVDHELQCLNANLGSFCQVVNANETIHQGVEAGFGAAIWKSIVVSGPALRAALQAPVGHLFRPQHRVGAAGLLRRQRQHV